MKTPPPIKNKSVLKADEMDFETPRAMKVYKPGNRICVSGQILVCQRVNPSGSTFVHENNRSKFEHLAAFYDLSIKILSSDDDENETTNNETENNMATKNENKPTRKIEYIDELLQSGKHTKAQVQAIAARKFPGIGENTTNWAASTMKKRTGRVSKHLKNGAVKKSPPKRKVVGTVPVSDEPIAD